MAIETSTFACSTSMLHNVISIHLRIDERNQATRTTSQLTAREQYAFELVLCGIEWWIHLQIRSIFFSHSVSSFFHFFAGSIYFGVGALCMLNVSEKFPFSVLILSIFCCCCWIFYVNLYVALSVCVHISSFLGLGKGKKLIESLWRYSLVWLVQWAFCQFTCNTTRNEQYTYNQPTNDTQ